MNDALRDLAAMVEWSRGQAREVLEATTPALAAAFQELHDAFAPLAENDNDPAQPEG